jgi:hypothetical protein
MIIARAVENWPEGLTYSISLIVVGFIFWCICHYGWPWDFRDDDDEIDDAE